MDGGGEGENLVVNGGDISEGRQLILVCYKNPPQDQLTMCVCGFVSRSYGVLLVV